LSVVSFALQRGLMGTDAPILVVDDDPVFLEYLVTRLGAAGHGVVSAGTGSEAPERCRSLRIDLVIADWRMPGMDGLELCRSLKADPALRQVYIILLTGRPGGPQDSPPAGRIGQDGSHRRGSFGGW